MKYLIVNADDLGASRGTNHGIIDAHRHGIVTSASLLVNTPWSAEAAALSATVPDLSVGLHIQLELDETDIAGELERQGTRFQKLVGRPPTHLDTHHNVHRHDPRVAFHALRLGRAYGVPVREHSPVRYCSKFYGQWGGESHPEHLCVENLVRMLETEVCEGVTELGCHPGYPDVELRSSYSIEREHEVRTLCAPALRTALVARGILLVGFRDLPQILVGVADARRNGPAA